MSYLALLSQVISFGALIFRSFQQIRKLTTTAQLFLNWQLLFIASSLESVVLYFQTTPKFSILAFFIIKLFIVFMPRPIHRILDSKLKSLHPQIIYDIVRCKMVNVSFRLFMKCTGYFLGFLDQQERRACGQVLMEQMQGDGNAGRSPNQMFISRDPKTYEQKEVQCTIITPVSLSSVYRVPPIPIRAKEEKFESKNMSEDKGYPSKVSKGGSAIDLAFKKNAKSPQFATTKFTLLHNQSSQIPQKHLPAAVAPTKHLPLPSVSASKYTQLPFQQLTKVTGMRRSATDAALFETKQKDPKTTKLVNELNMSVSEYSDLMDFDEEEEGGAGGLERREEKRKEHRAAAGGAMKIEKKVVEGKGIRDVHYLIKEPEVKRLQSPLGKLIVKVETYVQMGSRTYPRLQKYYAQLYPNDKMQIVSMHGRVFQKHTLKFMKKQENDYYQMHFAEETLPNVRVLKFKTDMGEFAKYIKS